MKKIPLSVALFSAILASMIFAQQPAGPPNPAAMAQEHIAKLATLLTLTDAQQAQAATIFSNAQTSASAARSALRTAHKGLESAVEQNDAAAIDTQAAQIGTLTGQLAAIQAKAEASFYALLTPEQQTKFKALHSRGGHRGPGGGAPGWGDRAPMGVAP